MTSAACWAKGVHSVGCCRSGPINSRHGLGPDECAPNKRCLSDLEAPLPDLGVPLTDTAHPVITSAQALPERRDAGGAERVVSFTDRVWFKIKTSDHRATATELPAGEIPEWIPANKGTWWIGAAGRRQNDSPQRDFYAALQRECTTGKTVSTDHLVRADWDWKRLSAEQAVAWRREMKRMVVGRITMSLKSGNTAVAEFRKHRIKALVRASNGHEAYLAIVAEGVPDPEMFALLLDCVPGVAAEDWQPEPSPVIEMSPTSGEIIRSTPFRLEWQARSLTWTTREASACSITSLALGAVSERAALPHR